jgi:hypothetical protein
MVDRDVTCAKWWLTRSTTTEAVMNRNHRIRRMGAALAVFACTLFGLGAGAPAAFAVRYPIPGGQQGAVTLRRVPPGLLKHPLPAQVHTVVVGGMPGWQIALIAAAAALVAATLAVLLDRAWAARQRVAATAAS